MVRVINEDYSQFLEVAQKLEHASDDVNYLKQPLTDLKSRLKQLCDVAYQKYMDFAKVRDQRRRYKKKLRTLEELRQAHQAINSLESTLPDLEQKCTTLANNLEEIQPNTEEQEKRHENIDVTQIQHCFQLLQKSLQCIRLYMDCKKSKENCPFFKELTRKKDNLSKRFSRACLRMLGTLVKMASRPDRTSHESTSRGDPPGLADELLQDGLELCLSCLSSLGEPAQGEKILCDILVQPVVSHWLTPGRMDGEVRGSFSNLETLLNDLADKIERDWRIIVNATRSALDIDFIVGCVWTTTVEQLGVPVHSTQPESDQSTPTLFSATDSTAFENGYWALSSFFKRLIDIAHRTRSSCVPRLLDNKATRLISQFWRRSAPIYFSIKASDICSEFDIELRSNSIVCSPEDRPYGTKETLQEYFEENSVYHGPQNSICLHTETGVSLVKTLTKIWRAPQIMPHIFVRLLNLTSQAIMRFCLWAEAGIMGSGKNAAECGSLVLKFSKERKLDNNAFSGCSVFVSEGVEILRKFQSRITRSRSFPIVKVQAEVSDADTKFWQSNSDTSSFLGLSHDLVVIGSLLEGSILPHIKHTTSNWHYLATRQNHSTEDDKSVHAMCDRMIQMGTSTLMGYSVPVLSVAAVQTAYKISKSWKEIVKSLAPRYRMRGKPTPTDPSEGISELLAPLHQLKNYQPIPLPSFAADDGNQTSSNFELYCLCCIEITSVSVMKSLKDLLEKEKSKDTTFNWLASGSQDSQTAEQTDLTDSQKIARQAHLDVNAFFDEAFNLVGHTVHESSSLDNLRELVAPYAPSARKGG